MFLANLLELRLVSNAHVVNMFKMLHRLPVFLQQSQAMVHRLCLPFLHHTCQFCHETHSLMGCVN